MEQQPAAYHVFINHRGPDVKKSLASLIYKRLTKYHGLRVFLDKDEIRTGETISNAIRTAIQSASVHITIFSERYAESWWCLEELYWILRSYHKHNRKVIPVFCGVQPADLRHIESGCYKNAFDQHQSKERVSTEKIEKWKKTLSEASDISGIFFQPNESDYGEILEDIVQKVLKEVFKWGSLYVAKYPVGLDHVAEHPLINKILKQSDVSDTMIVGIAGMSGIGKTTLAKYLYNLRHLSFNGKSCFLSNVRTKDLAKLQQKLLSDLHGYTQDLQDIDSIDEGRRLLPHCPILLVLDDVDHIDQINDLLDIDSVGRGSLILITARDKDLLRRSSPETVLYDVKPLNKQHARDLFCQYAFRGSKPSEELEDSVEEFLEICNGLPLALKVLGGQFVGKSDKDYWRRQLKRFSTTPDQELIRNLKACYDALNDEEKEAFLDIGCFLVGEETELTIRVLSGLYGSNIVHSLESLHQKCLVDFHYDVQWDDEIECRKPEDPMIGDDDRSLLKYRGYKLAMHDQLRQLARHIARQDFPVLPTCKPLRVSCSEDIIKLSESHGASHLPIRGIRTSRHESPPDFASFRGECVHLLVLEVPIDLRSLVGSWKLSRELVWLRLRNFRFGSIPFHSYIRLPKLRVLELDGHIDNIDQFFRNFDLAYMHRNFSKPCSRLNELNISGVPSTSSSSSTLHAGHSMKVSENYSPSAVQQGSVMPHLIRFLKWTGLEYLCKMVLTNLSSLQSLPINFGEVARLRHLDLSGCNNLTELPKSFSKLLHLQYLSLRGCWNLSIPPDILGQISTLEYVDFKECAQLLVLPEGIPYQRHLRYLNLLFTRLSHLPEEVGQLGNLNQLRIGSRQLTRLPRSVAHLRGLTELIMIQCDHLQCFSPEGIAAPNIKFLAVDFCPIANFSFQKDQQTMGVLRDLTLKRTSISEICMAEGVYPWLQTINLSENIQLKQVIALPSALVRVNLQDCSQLETLNLSTLVNLKFLNINGCIALETLGVRGLTSVEEIEAERCWKLKRIEGMNSLKCLNSLKISTDNKIFWENLCSFSNSAPGVRLPNFMLTGKVDDEMDKGQIRRNMFQLQSIFHFQSVRFNSSITRIHDSWNQGSWLQCPMGFRHNSECGILWFITNDVGGYSIRVAFEESFATGGRSPVRISQGREREIFATGGRSPLWISQGRESGGRRLHIFMWSPYSKCFMEYLKLAPRLRNIGNFVLKIYSDASASELEQVLVEGVWVLTPDSMSAVLEACMKIIAKFASKSSSWSVASLSRRIKGSLISRL